MKFLGRVLDAAQSRGGLECTHAVERWKCHGGRMRHQLSFCQLMQAELMFEPVGFSG